MLQYLLDNDRCSPSDGISVWQEMAEKKVVSRCSWPTLKERFKTILKKLHLFNLSEEEKQCVTKRCSKSAAVNTSSLTILRRKHEDQRQRLEEDPRKEQGQRLEEDPEKEEGQRQEDKQRLVQEVEQTEVEQTEVEVEQTEVEQTEVEQTEVEQTEVEQTEVEVEQTEVEVAVGEAEESVYLGLQLTDDSSDHDDQVVANRNTNFKLTCFVARGIRNWRSRIGWVTRLSRLRVLRRCKVSPSDCS